MHAPQRGACERPPTLLPQQRTAFAVASLKKPTATVTRALTSVKACALSRMPGQQLDRPFDSFPSGDPSDANGSAAPSNLVRQERLHVLCRWAAAPAHRDPAGDTMIGADMEPRYLARVKGGPPEIDANALLARYVPSRWSPFWETTGRHLLREWILQTDIATMPTFLATQQALSRQLFWAHELGLELTRRCC